MELFDFIMNGLSLLLGVFIGYISILVFKLNKKIKSIKNSCEETYEQLHTSRQDLEKNSKDIEDIAFLSKSKINHDYGIIKSKSKTDILKHLRNYFDNNEKVTLYLNNLVYEGSSNKEFVKNIFPEVYYPLNSKFEPKLKIYFTNDKDDHIPIPIDKIDYIDTSRKDKLFIFFKYNE